MEVTLAPVNLEHWNHVSSENMQLLLIYSFFECNNMAAAEDYI